MENSWGDQQIVQFLHLNNQSLLINKIKQLINGKKDKVKFLNGIPVVGDK